MSERQKVAEQNRVQPKTASVRLPGFVLEEEIGLGDAVKKVTYALGIKPCGACEKRAAALNRWMSFR
jgi:hypothetical protein